MVEEERRDDRDRVSKGLLPICGARRSHGVCNQRMDLEGDEWACGACDNRVSVSVVPVLTDEDETEFLRSQHKRKPRRRR